MDSHAGSLVAVVALFLVLTWVSFSLRIYVRSAISRSWGMDDWALLLTVIIFTCSLVFSVVSVIHGLGQHRWEVNNSDAKIALLYFYLFELFYVISTCTLKISLGLSLLRVTVRRGYVLAIKMLMIGTILYGLSWFYLVLLQCRPVSEFWTNHPVSDRCFSKTALLGVTYAMSGVNAFADLAFGILPFFIARDLGMDRKTNMLVAGILAFGAIGTAATLVRMKYIPDLTNGSDLLYAIPPFSIWTIVEPGTFITVLSLSTLRPLLSTTTPPSSRPPPLSQTHPCTTSTTITGGPRTATTKSWGSWGMSRSVSRFLKVSDEEAILSPQHAHTHAAPTSSTTAQQQQQFPQTTAAMEWAFVDENPPRLQLPDSIYRSFVRGSVLSLRQLIQDGRGGDGSGSSSKHSAKHSARPSPRSTLAAAQANSNAGSEAAAAWPLPMPREVGRREKRDFEEVVMPRYS